MTRLTAAASTSRSRSRAACRSSAASCCATPACASSTARTTSTARVENFPIDLMFVRDDDIPTFVSDGVCEFGIVGRNVLEEFALGEAERRFEVVADARLRPLRLQDRGARTRRPMKGRSRSPAQRIATSYPRLLQPLSRRERGRGDRRQDERRGRAGAAAADRQLHLRPGVDRRDARGQRPARRSRPCSTARRC